jgi:hypothetical protein
LFVKNYLFIIYFLLKIMIMTLLTGESVFESPNQPSPLGEGANEKRKSQQDAGSTAKDYARLQYNKLN